MKKWSWALTGFIVIIVVLVFAYINTIKSSLTIEDIKKSKTVLELSTYDDYTVFIEKINSRESKLKVHNSSSNNVKEIEAIKGNLSDISWSSNGRYFKVSEGDSLVKTTYIVLLENIEEEIEEDIDKIKTVGDSIWSPSGEKLLIGVENNKGKTVNGDLNGTIDLAVYYVNSKVVEPILEADELRDYYPVSWYGDNSIEYIEVKDGVEENFTFKYQVSNEEMLMGIIYSEYEQKDISELISLLPDLDFNRLERIYGEESVLNLLEWLSEAEVKGEEEIVILLSLLDEFLGEENHKYLEILSKSYLGDKVNFIKALSKFPNKVEEVAYALHDFSIYEGNEEAISKDLIEVITSDKLNNREKDIGIHLLNTYNACGT